MIAAGHTGANVSSRLHHGEGHHRDQFGPIFIPAHVVRKYSASKIIAAVHFHMRTAFGFALPQIHSLKSRLLTAPTVAATISVAHSKLAKASDREGV